MWFLYYKLRKLKSEGEAKINGLLFPHAIVSKITPTEKMSATCGLWHYEEITSGATNGPFLCDSNNPKLLY